MSDKVKRSRSFRSVETACTSVMKIVWMIVYLQDTKFFALRVRFIDAWG